MNNQHPLQQIWDKYPNAMHNEKQSLKAPPIKRLIAEMFCIGNFYYYVLNIADSTLTNHHESILTMHGLKKYPKHLKEVIDLIHPDDIEFIMEAEKMTIEKMQEIGWEHQTQLKSSYCFRMKTETDHYEMFHHQSIHTLKSKDGKLLQAVNIHTNIQHLVKENPYTVLVSGIGNRSDFHQMHYSKESKEKAQETLTKRELEILNFITKGLSASEISKILNISFYTVRTHRKNILEKMQSKNTSELMKICFQRGLI